jgi:hypothetical protein
MKLHTASEVARAGRQNPKLLAEVAELADARDSKSREVTPHVGSIPTFGTLQLGCRHKCV